MREDEAEESSELKKYGLYLGIFLGGYFLIGPIIEIWAQKIFNIPDFNGISIAVALMLLVIYYIS